MFQENQLYRFREGFQLPPWATKSGNQSLGQLHVYDFVHPNEGLARIAYLDAWVRVGTAHGPKPPGPGPPDLGP